MPRERLGKHLLVGTSQQVHSPSAVWQHVVDVALHQLPQLDMALLPKVFVSGAPLLQLWKMSSGTWCNVSPKT